MSQSAVIFIFVVAAVAAVVGVVAVAFERKRAREQAPPDRVPTQKRRSLIRRRGRP